MKAPKMIYLPLEEVEERAKYLGTTSKVTDICYIRKDVVIELLFLMLMMPEPQTHYDNL